MHAVEDARKELERHGFTVQELIGRGCFGVVHRVTDSKGNVRAVKTVRVRKNKAPRNTQRTLRETVRDEVTVANALAARLRQAPSEYYGVVKVYGTIETPYYYHIVMECLSGEDLQTYMQRYRDGMPLPLVKRLAWSVLRGLAVMHGVGALHRDLKPDNIFVELDRAGNVLAFKLIDVGLGRVAARKAEGEGRMLACSCVGSPLYRSPLVEKGYEYGEECDVWGAGYMMYYAATGRCLTSTDKDKYKEEKLYVLDNCDTKYYEFPYVRSDDVKALLRASMSREPSSLQELLDDYWFMEYKV